MLDIALCIILLHTAAAGVPWIYALNVGDCTGNCKSADAHCCMMS